MEPKGKMTFIEKSLLERRGPTEEAAPEGVPTFLIGERWVAMWGEGHDQGGNDCVSVWPAWVGGKRAWVLKRVWVSYYGYNASGTIEEIITFERGIRLMLNHGCFEIIGEATSGETDGNSN